MLPVSSLSLMANGLRELLEELIEELSSVSVGNPRLAAEQAQGGKQVLNLFFYLVEYGGYPPDGSPMDPFYVRVNCLVTAMCSKETDPDNGTVSEGENELRLLGQAMRILHENPVLLVGNESTTVQLQMVLLPLTLDDMHRLWATLGDVPYRLSAAYQLSLLPVPLQEAGRRSPLVAGYGLKVRGSMEREPLPEEGFSVPVPAPGFKRISVDTSRPGWSPQLAFLGPRGELRTTLTFQAERLPVSVRVLAAGDPGSEITLFWDRWDPEAEGPWRSVGAGLPIILRTDTLDPALEPSELAALSEEIEIPLSGPGQALLSARRDFVRLDGARSVARSNPLLLVVYGGGS
jgi:hypothetical protein